MTAGEITAPRELTENILQEYKSGARLDPETGELVFSGLPIIFSRASILSSIYSGLEGLMGESAAGVLRKLGQDYGRGFYDLLSQGPHGDLLDQARRRELLEFVCAETQAIGWGRISIAEEEGRVIITSGSGLAAGRNYMPAGGSKRPVDAYFVGYFESFFGTVDSTAYRGSETECVAAGDPVCRIVLERV